MPKKEEQALYALIGRALVDPAYRKRIKSKRQHRAVLNEVLGREPTARDLAAFGKAAKAVDDLYGSFGLKRYSA